MSFQRDLHEIAMRYVGTKNVGLELLLARSEARQRDCMRQAMLNNLWGNNPGELERWADDGGREP